MKIGDYVSFKDGKQKKTGYIVYMVDDAVSIYDNENAHRYSEIPHDEITVITEWKKEIFKAGDVVDFTFGIDQLSEHLEAEDGYVAYVLYAQFDQEETEQDEADGDHRIVKVIVIKLNSDDEEQATYVELDLYKHEITRTGKNIFENYEVKKPYKKDHWGEGWD